ncbi:glycosyltransferase family 8 protein [Streptomyces sp. NPDC006638]|uniref:glycosyltransferase family 8 protein n=1 Tax=unclassified Streptomyces TaxID=2593676 RepID=UPI0033B6E65C
MGQQDLHVVFAVDQNYVDAAAVVAHSIGAGLRDTSSRPAFHVIDSGLGADGRRFLADALGRVGDVDLYTVPDRLEMATPRKHWTAATLHRLHIGDVVPRDIGRVIYLDVDTLVLDDLTELYRYDLAGNTIGAVINEVAPARVLTLGERASLSQTGAKPPGYFNAGVLLIDMDRWRAENTTERSLDIYRTYGKDIPTLDQDILNYLYAERWTPVPDKWNKLIEHPVHGRFGSGRLDYLTRREGIIHFIGGDKPWGDVFPDNALRRLYEEYSSVLALTGSS